MATATKTTLQRSKTRQSAATKHRPPGQARRATSNKATADLCLNLMRADTEREVVDALSKAGYWDDQSAWRPISDEENNFSTIGNQQSEAVSALVEKIVNGVDARLLDQARRAGIDPVGRQAPKSMRTAVAKFFEHAPQVRSHQGRIANWTDAEATEQAKLLTVAATGNMPAQGYPSITIADQGEGQTPDSVPLTFMSLQKSNKLRIPFVQGKFNMGGTGALQFLHGQHKLQLIMTKRDPELLPPWATPRDKMWSFTVVRREPPRNGARNSVYTYLAPVEIDGEEQKGVLAFPSKTMPIFPEADAKVRDAYCRESEYGSLVKLYEYEWHGTKSNIVLAGDGLLRRIDAGLPELALPVRLYECREKYRGASGSFATNAMGLVSRLERDRGGNLEPESPLGAGITLAGVQIPLRIYVFKPDKAKQYRSPRQGVIFGVNGQTHGTYSIDFFRRKSVGMSYLADSLLVFADCSAIEGFMREDLFMNSRDRLRDTPLARELEAKLESVIRNEATLRELGNRRRQAALQDRLRDDRPLADVVEGLMKSNPMLSKLLLSGMQLAAPFPPEGGVEGSGRGASKVFVPKQYPSFFRFKDKKADETLNRKVHVGSRARLTMETDAPDDYFIRPDEPGEWTVEILTDEGYVEAPDFTWTGPKEGIAQLWIDMPEALDSGQEIEYRVQVTDPTQVAPFVNQLDIQMIPPLNPSEGGSPNPPRVRNADRTFGGGDSMHLALPEVTPVHRHEWPLHGFGENSALKIVNVGVSDTGPSNYDFFVNVDNKYLKIIQKETNGDPSLLEKQFTYGFVLLGLALIQDATRHRNMMEAGEAIDVEEYVARTSRALAPVLLPIIQAIGGLSLDDLQ